VRYSTWPSRIFARSSRFLRLRGTNRPASAPVSREARHEDQGMLAPRPADVRVCMIRDFGEGQRVGTQILRAWSQLKLAAAAAWQLSGVICHYGCGRR
jgi:hypothetical protein